MSEVSRFDPTGRFTGLAATYAQFRPDYPDAALDYLMQHCGLGSGSVLVDVGSGTGISSRAFAERGLRVIGIEPNTDMRDAATAEPAADFAIAPSYRFGRAEATGLAAGMADLILAAQAFHWFESTEALTEFRRVLKPTGWVALLWNERDESDPCTAQFGATLRSTSEGAAVESGWGRSGEALLTSELFRNGQQVGFPHEQSLDEQGLLGRAFSASYAPREPDRAAPFADALRAIFARYQRDERVTLRYRTTATLAQAAPV